MTTEQQAKVDAIERDRKRREKELLLLLLLLLRTANNFAIHAIRLDTLPTDAALRVWLGYAGGFRGAIGPIANLMMDSHAAGMARGASFVGGPKPTPNDVPGDLYRDMAQTMAREAGETLRRTVSDAVMNAPDNVKEQARAIRDAFNAGGYTADNPYAVERIATGAVMKSYGLGLWSAYGSADVRGFRHVSVLDDVTTEICKERDGLTLPKDDDYWLGTWPPLHFNCRSTILPVVGNAVWSTTYPTTPPTPGFGTIPQEMLAIARPFAPRAA